MRCIIGIDLGTSRSGYSYAFGKEPSGIKFPQQYTRDDLSGAAKTDTALLFEVEGRDAWRLDSWGTSAVNKYTQGLFGEEGRRYRLVTGKQFKLALCAPDPSKLPPECQLPPDCPYSAAELITLMLSCLRDHARQQLAESVKFDMDAAEVHFCLSVPAGWSLKAKRIMHYAAEQANMKLNTTKRDLSSTSIGSSASNSSSSNGTGGGGSSSRWDSMHSSRDQGPQQGGLQESASAVVLIHEQEAAALTACIDPMKDVPTLRAIPGEVWMILDAGGGTVDIAMHQIEASKHHPGESQLSERLRSRCLLLGSSMLDGQAEANLLLPLFDSLAAYQAWKSEDPQSYISQMRDWEEIKTKWDGNSTEYLKLDYGLLERLPANPPGVQRGRLPVSPEDMRRLVFEPVLAPILENVKEMLATRRRSGGSGADILVLAGGFGSSPYLQRRLTEECGTLLKNPPVRPNNTGRAVVLGNTIHLQRPDAILSRVARLTYGINVGDHPTEACKTHGRCITDRKGRTWCETHFRPLVRINDVVEIGQATEPFVVYPLPDAEVVHVPIYATDSPDAAHTTEPGMQRVGVVHVKVEKTPKFKLGLLKAGRMSCDDYKIELRFRFGAAEVQVLAFDVTHKRNAVADFTFSNEAAGAEHNRRVNLPGVGGMAGLQL